MLPKYAILEIERRWLARLDRLPTLAELEFVLIEDIYFAGTRMRLRKMTLAGGLVYKLGKKYGKISDIEEPIANIYLDEAEYAFFATLPGRRLARRRYPYAVGRRTYFISVILNGEGPILIEAEYPSRESALADTPPDFCGLEVSADADFEAVRFAGL